MREVIGDLLQHRLVQVDTRQMQVLDVLEEQQVISSGATANVRGLDVGKTLQTFTDEKDGLRIGLSNLSVGRSDVGKMVVHRGIAVHDSLLSFRFPRMNAIRFSSFMKWAGNQFLNPFSTPALRQ